MKKKKEEKIPFSNYVKLFLITALTLALSLVLRNLYLSNENYEKNIPIIRDVLVSEINSNEVYNYIRENENTILYIGVSYDDNCREIEKELKTIIEEKHLEDKITYLNITKNNKKQSFIKEFNKFYSTKVLGYPTLILFEEGKVKDIITVKVGHKLEIKEIKDFFKRNNITFDYD